MKTVPKMVRSGTCTFLYFTLDYFDRLNTASLNYSCERIPPSQLGRGHLSDRARSVPRVSRLKSPPTHRELFDVAFYESIAVLIKKCKLAG